MRAVIRVEIQTEDAVSALEVADTDIVMLDLIGLYKLIPQADFFPFIFQIFIKQVDDALSANVANLDEKVLAANNDILSYTATLQEKTSDFERISGDSADKVLDLTEVLNKRYEYLQKVTADGLKQLQSADKEINSATENLIVQTAQSVENINKVSEIMQKNTNNLNYGICRYTIRRRI